MSIQLIPAVPVPFLADGALDEKGLAPLYGFLDDAGVDGVFVSGTTGEFPALDDAERDVVLTEALAVFGPERVYAHVGAASARQAERLAARAVALGATTLAAITPYYLPAGPAGARRPLPADRRRGGGRAAVRLPLSRAHDDHRDPGAARGARRDPRGRRSEDQRGADGPGRRVPRAPCRRGSSSTPATTSTFAAVVRAGAAGARLRGVQRVPAAVRRAPRRAAPRGRPRRGDGPGPRRAGGRGGGRQRRVDQGGAGAARPARRARPGWRSTRRRPRSSTPSRRPCDRERWHGSAAIAASGHDRERGDRRGRHRHRLPDQGPAAAAAGARRRERPEDQPGQRTAAGAAGPHGTARPAAADAGHRPLLGSGAAAVHRELHGEHARGPARPHPRAHERVERDVRHVVRAHQRAPARCGSPAVPAGSGPTSARTSCSSPPTARR